MKISAVVPAFNAQPFLARAVKSLLDTGYPSLEILVIDDGSTDRTLAEAYLLQSAHPSQVRVLRHPEGANRGVSASRNLGIRQATGDVLCFLDADDHVLPHRFEVAIQILTQRPDVDGVYELTCISLKEPASGNGLGSPSQDGGAFALATALEGDALLAKLLSGYPWHPDAFLCRRAMFDRTGTFDETLRIAEDCHLWFRAAALCSIVPGELQRPVAMYVRHAANTYRYTIERKVDLVRAMRRAWPTVRNAATPAVRKAYLAGLAAYVCNALVVSREAGRTDVAWAIARQTAPVRWGALLLRMPLLRQLVWLSVETVMRPRRASVA